MLTREFLEEYPLYRKLRFKKELPESLPLRRVTLFPAIHMQCPTCRSKQTFTAYEGWEPILPSGEPQVRGCLAYLPYQCAACERNYRVFFLKFDPEGTYVMKVGQLPSWEISPDRDLEKILGDRADYYKKGLICESQSYGIGAYSYYRRIVEEIIDELLGQISDLMADKERERYLEALEEVTRTRVTEEKIRLVKDLLPPILRPEGMNPLSALHDALSEGMHRQSDQRCTELAATVREVLEFLVKQIKMTQAAASSFTESMRKLLDRKSQAIHPLGDAE